jgi:superfamily I DNA/RNA helicase
MPRGAYPEIVPVSSAQDEITRVVNEVSELVRRGVAKAHVLVIHADWGGQQEIIRRLGERLGPGTAFDPKEANHADGVRVCTLNAAGGIESPIVLLAGTGSLLEQEHSIRISDEERQDLVRDNSRMLCMAITRAGQRLMNTVPDRQAEQFQVVAQAMVQDATQAAGVP